MSISELLDSKGDAITASFEEPDRATSSGSQYFTKLTIPGFKTMIVGKRDRGRGKLVRRRPGPGTPGFGGGRFPRRGS